MLAPLAQLLSQALLSFQAAMEDVHGGGSSWHFDRLVFPVVPALRVLVEEHLVHLILVRGGLVEDVEAVGSLDARVHRENVVGQLRASRGRLRPDGFGLLVFENLDQNRLVLVLLESAPLGLLVSHGHQLRRALAERLFADSVRTGSLDFGSRLGIFAFETLFGLIPRRGRQSPSA